MNELKEKIFNFIYEYSKKSSNKINPKFYENLKSANNDDIVLEEEGNGYNVKVFTENKEIGYQMWISNILLNGFKKYSILSKENYNN